MTDRELVLMARIEELEALVFTDELTGLGNRRALDRVLEKEVARAHRHRLHLSVIAIDIDHFKAVNDTHGHAAGDDVLRRVARNLRDTVRLPDYVFRQGGEEMMVIAQVDEQGALVLAEKLRAAVAGGHEDCAAQVTASFGVATLSRSFENPAPLLDRADSALYKAKAAGRDRVWEA